MPKFYYNVFFGSRDRAISFQEVSGLETNVSPFEYRSGDATVFSTIKMPGIVKSSNVTLRKGLLEKDHSYVPWFENIKMNTIKREQVTIQLLDDSKIPILIWTLINAWPTKITLADLEASGNEVAIETLELAHEGLNVSIGR